MQSGHRTVIVDRSVLTHSIDWLRDFGATQHGQRAVIRSYKCLISYSITLSAPSKSEVARFSPSAFAVLRLITNSNFLACSTGRSAGFVPLSILDA